MPTYLIPDVGDTVTIPVVTSCVRASDSLVTEYPIESRAAKTDFIVPMAETVNISGVIDGVSLAAGFADRFFGLRARVFTLQCDLGTIPNCALKSPQLAKEPGDGDQARVSFTAKQILVAEARVTKIPRTPGAGKTSPAKDGGRQPEKDPDQATSDAYDSMLSRATGFGVSF